MVQDDETGWSSPHLFEFEEIMRCRSSCCPEIDKFHDLIGDSETLTGVL